MEGRGPAARQRAPPSAPRRRPRQPGKGRTDGRREAGAAARLLASPPSPRVRRHGPAIGERSAPRGDSPRGPPASQAGGGVGGGRRVAARPGGGGAGVPGRGGREDAGRFLAAVERARLRVRGRQGPRPPRAAPPPPPAAPPPPSRSPRQGAAAGGGAAGSPAQGGGRPPALGADRLLLDGGLGLGATPGPGVM